MSKNPLCFIGARKQEQVLCFPVIYEALSSPVHHPVGEHLQGVLHEPPEDAVDPGPERQECVVSVGKPL